MCGKVVDEGLPLASGIRYGEASRPHRVFGNYQKSTYYAAYALTPPTHILQINIIWSFIELGVRTKSWTIWTVKLDVYRGRKIKGNQFV